MHRGDVVTGDRDGVVVVAAGEWEAHRRRAREASEREAEIVRGIGAPAA